MALDYVTLVFCSLGPQKFAVADENILARTEYCVHKDAKDFFAFILRALLCQHLSKSLIWVSRVSWFIYQICSLSLESSMNYL